MQKSSRKKVIVIGLDGADWRLLDDWLNQGELPELATLIQNGAKGKLRSTIRPESSVAWSSFATGVNPGKHGVFGFAAHEPKTYSYNLVNSTSVRTPAFWDFLGEQGFTVGLFNVPITYPPRPVNGFLIGGMLTPSVDSNFTYPAELQVQLNQRFGTYILDPSEGISDRISVVERVKLHTAQQVEIALDFLKDSTWDFFGIVFTGPDRLQHFFWPGMDHLYHTPGSMGGETNAEVLLAHYRSLDKAIGRILDQLPADTLVMIMSDHGFNAVARRFYVNAWLQKQGLLSQRSNLDLASRVVPLMNRLKSVPYLRNLKNRLFSDTWGPAQMQRSLVARSIDWPRTSVYYAPDGGLRINLIGREPNGIVQPGEDYERLRNQLRQSLLEIKDSKTGEDVIACVYFREELYLGPCLDLAPDIIVEPHRGHADADHNYILDGKLDDQALDVFGSSAPYSGNHALDGILIASGQSIISGDEISGARIEDIAPTVLASLGAKVPDSLDGRVLTELFIPEGMPEVSYYSPEHIAPSLDDSHSFTPDESAMVEDRLRDLGYLD